MHAPSRPQAVVSHVLAEPDETVARRIELALRGVAFDVTMRGHLAGDSGAWRQNEHALFQAQVFVPIVSRVYLTQTQCRDELSLCIARTIKERMLLAPVAIEPIDDKSLGDDDARWAWRSLQKYAGFLAGRHPEPDEVDEIAAKLAKQVVAENLWRSPLRMYESTADAVVRTERGVSHRDVFISYSSHDGEVAKSICSGLEDRGIGCWMAPRDILPGAPYGRAVIEGLSASRVLVLVYSSHSNVSEHVVKEVERACSRRLLVIPFRIEDTPLSPDLEYYLSSPQWLDALTSPLVAHVERLATVVRVQLDQMGARPPAAAAAIPPSTEPRLPPETTTGATTATATAPSYPIDGGGTARRAPAQRNKREPWSFSGGVLKELVYMPSLEKRSFMHLSTRGDTYALRTFRGGRPDTRRYVPGCENTDELLAQHPVQFSEDVSKDRRRIDDEEYWTARTQELNKAHGLS